MKISINQMFRKYNQWCFGLLTVALMAFTFNSAAQGEALFKAKCASCHQPHKDGTGPKLFEVRAKWSAGSSVEDGIYNWVNNWQNAAASDPYANTVSAWSPTAMNMFPDLNKAQIDEIMDWVDAQPLPGAAVPGEPGDGGTVVAGETQETSNTWIWVLLGAIFFVVIAAVGGVRRQLKNATSLSEGKEVEEGLSYWGEFKSWAYHNKGKVGLTTMLVVLTLAVWGLQGLGNIGVVSGYQPSQPIAFPHDIHTGVNGIDCKYCHNSVDKSKSAGLPTINVCMNCHKQINGVTPAQQLQIAKLYDAAGFDPANGGSYNGKTKEIVWNKVHALPDHVYFPHSQHVNVGGIDCKQCHGDMTKQKEVAKIQPVEELNKIEGNVQLTRPTLTMGWCIECHGEKEVATGPLDGKGGYYAEIHKRLLNNDRKLYDKYLEDGKVTVKELGGWECAKCHY